MAKARKSKSTKNLRDLRDPLDYPETRIERYLKCIKTGDNTDLPSTVNTRIERYLYCIATGDNSTLPDHPETMIELYLDAIATGNVQDLPHDPQDRLQRYLYAAAYVDSSLLPSADYTRLEKYISSILGGTTFVTDQVPYLFRVSGGEENANVKHKELDTLVGATLAWNQMIENGNFVDASGWDGVGYGTITASGNKGHYTITDASDNARIEKNVSLTSGHKYIVTFSVTTPKEEKIGFGYTSNSNVQRALTTANTKLTSQFIFSAANNASVLYFYCNKNSTLEVGDVVDYENIWLTDLTHDFGSEIADYVYALEQGNAGDGVEWLKSHGFFTKDYYSYDPGSLQSVCVSAHIMRDADNQIIASYPLDHSVIRRGIYKLDANNKLYADGDTDDGKGTMTIKYEIVDMGTLDWTYADSRFRSDTVEGKPTSANDVANICSTIYIPMTGLDYKNFDKTMALSTSGALLIHDTAYNDAATFKTAMSGIYLVYELATPTTATVEPFTNPQQVDKAGTEEYVDFSYFVEDRDVEVPVGHITQYPQ